MKLIVSSHVSYLLEVPDDLIEGFTGKKPEDITDTDLDMMGNETDGLGWALWEQTEGLLPGDCCDAYIELHRGDLATYAHEPVNEVTL